MRLWRYPQNRRRGHACAWVAAVAHFTVYFWPEAGSESHVSWYRMNQVALRISELPKATGVMYTHRQALFLYSHRLVLKVNHILWL